MASNEEQKPGSESQADYEAAVLDFLDKEMSAIQPDNEQKESGEELDAIVTDLLKQVITESDQSNQGQNVASDGLEDVMAEFPPTEVEAESSSSKNLESSESTLNPPALTERDAPEEPIHEPLKSQSSKSSAASIFAPVAESKRKRPVIAIAAICMLAAIGGAIYYFMGSSEGNVTSAESQPAVSIPPAPVNPEPVPQVADSQSDKIAMPKKDTPKTAAKSAPAKPRPKPAALKSEPVKPAIVETPANPTQSLEPEIVTVTPSTNQTPAPTPLATTSNLAIERSTPPPMPDGIDLANSGAEKQSIQPLSSPLSSAKKATPSSKPQAPAAAATRTPVPAVPISRTSPVYPELAVRARSSGTVVLDLEIDKAGKVTKATPVSGPSVFYDAAVKAVMKWRYRPATINGANVSSKSTVTMVFNLNR